MSNFTDLKGTDGRVAIRNNDSERLMCQTDCVRQCPNRIPVTFLDMARLQNTLDGLQQEMTPYKKYIKHTKPMLQNIIKYYRKADGVTKNKILCCIFDEKLVLENGRVAATPFSPAVQVLLNITNRFQRVEKKKEADFDLFSEFAPLRAQSCNTFALQQLL